MPIFSAFIAKFINFDKRMQVDPNMIKSMKNMEKFDDIKQREKIILGEDFIAKAEKEEKKSINLRK